MDIFYNVLMKIKKMPGLFIEKPSLKLLDAFIFGYSYRQYEVDAGYQSSIEFFPDFQQYVEKYYGVDSGPMGYANIILSHIDSEEEAFYKFYELLESFLNEKE